MKTNGNMDWLEVMAEKVSTVRDEGGEDMWEAVSTLAAAQRRRARARRTIAMVTGLAAAAAVSALFLIPKGAVDDLQNATGLLAENHTVETVGPETSEPVTPAATVARKRLAAAEASAADVRPSDAAETVISEVRTADDPATPAVSATPANTSDPSAAHPESTPAPQTGRQDNGVSPERYIASLYEEKPRGRRLSIAVNSGSSAAIINSNNTFSTLVPVSSDNVDNYPAAQVRSTAESNGFNPDPKYVLKLLNRQLSVPVVAAVTLSYGLSDRLSVESGVNYTVLAETITNGGKSLRTTYHYLGIPLALKYDIYSMGKSNFYTKAGGMAEKFVGASTENVIEPSGLLWSVSGSAGYQYRFAGCCGIYLESGVSYHFDNGEGNGIIYNESPLLFTFQTGLRFTL